MLRVTSYVLDMAHTKAQKAVKGNRDSQPKRRGVKIFGGQKAVAGNIIVRQKGNKFFSGEGTMQGNDFTIMALRDGKVLFKTKLGKKYICVI